MRYKIVFDTSILLHSHYHVLKKQFDKVNPDEFYKRIMSTVDATLFELTRKKLSIGELTFCVDSRSFRYDIFPNYKGSRPDKKDLENLFDIMIERLSKKFTCIKNDKLEADDIAYLFSRKHDNCILVSEDNDYLQMIDKSRNVFMYKPFKRKLIQDCDNYYESLEKLLLGCSSDSIPKCLVGRVGKKILKTHYDSVIDEENIFKSLIESLSQKNITLNREQFKINSLITLYSVDNYKGFITNFEQLWQNF